jgi:hypothetical protein
VIHFASSRRTPTCQDERVQRVIMMAATATMMAATVAMAQPASFDAYLWQRSASPSVQRAVTAFGQHSRGRLHVVAVDDAFEQRHASLLRVLRSTATPVVLTLRFHTLPADASRVLATLQWWVQQGVTVDAIEIDHDCPTAGLSAYAGWLSSVRAALLTGDAGVGLEITALPTWLDHPDHLALFAVATEVTLQVHAIAAPALLDVDAARRAIARATLERPNVRVALPSYAVTLKGGQPLHARPADVAAVRLAANDVSWFRLPTDDDDTAWDWSTLLAVDSAPGVIADTDAVTVSAIDDGDGTVRVVVDNGRALAAPLPAVRVMGAESMDAIIPGRLVFTTLSSLQARFLLPHGRAVLGWARPSSAAGAFHVTRVDDALPFPAAVLPAGGGLNLPAGH